MSEQEQKQETAGAGRTITRVFEAQRARATGQGTWPGRHDPDRRVVPPPQEKAAGATPV